MYQYELTKQQKKKVDSINSRLSKIDAAIKNLEALKQNILDTECPQYVAYLEHFEAHKYDEHDFSLSLKDWHGHNNRWEELYYSGNDVPEFGEEHKYLERRFAA